MSDTRDLTTATNEDAIISPTATSSTLSLRANSTNPIQMLRTPRWTAVSASVRATFDIQGLSFDIWQLGYGRVKLSNKTDVND